MSSVDALISALRSRCGFEPAELSTKGQLRILARVNQVDNWRIIMQKIKAAELKSTWTLDLSQLYFLKTQSPRAPLVKGWRLILKPDKPENLEAACQQITAVAQTAPTARVTVDEFPLPGGGMHRNYGNRPGMGVRDVSGGGSGSPALEYFPKLGS